MFIIRIIFTKLKNLQILTVVPRIVIVVCVVTALTNTATYLRLRWFQSNINAKASNIQSTNRDQYQNLLARQSRNNLITDSNEYKFDPSKALYKAIGEHTVHLILVKSPKTSHKLVEPLITKLNQPTGKGSLRYVKEFIEAEAKKYYITGLSINPVVHGVYDLDQLTKVGDMTMLWNKDIFSILKLQDDFENLLKEEHPEIGNQELVIFLYFDNEVSSDSEFIYSYYDFKKFRSFALPEKARAFVDLYNVNEDFAETAVEVTIHEFLHLFGASDKYIESSAGACDSNGRGTITQFTPVKQTKADIMCLYIENPQGRFTKGNLKDNTLKINTVTAEEIGWLN